MAEFSIPRTNHAYRTSGEIFRSRNGPIDPSGRVFDLSDRPLFCSSSNMRNEVVIGGTDHALYAIDALDPRKRPVTMYTKTHGHTDWVTSVAHLPSGQVLSGAMDGKLCLWSAHNRAICTDLSRESTHPISKIIADLRYETAVACSYDGNIEIYSFPSDDIPKSTGTSSTAVTRRSLGGGSRIPAMRIAPTKILQGHSQPVLEASYHQGTLVTGDKAGSLMVWDLNEGQALHRFRAHPGAVTNLYCSDSGNVIISAAVDGYVKIWDPRSSGSGLVHKIPVHVQASNPQPIMTRPSRVAPGGRVSAGSATYTGRGNASRPAIQNSSSSSSAPASAPTGAPISVMAVTFARGSNSDLSYIVTGGGSPADSRLCVVDARMLGESSVAPPILAQYDHHRNGIYSLCVVGDDVVFSGDGMGTLLCHHLIEGDIDDGRACLKYGLGASSAGAVRSINCVGNKIVTVGEDGKALVFDYE